MKLVLIFILLFSICGCSKAERKTDDIFAMDTIISLDVYGENAALAISEMGEEVKRLDLKFSPDATTPIDDETEKIINFSEDVASASDGAFNIYLGDVMRIWGFRDKNYRIPDYDEIQTALSNKSLDFGGIAKGYAGDRLKEIAEKHGIKSGILSLGGNVVAIGKNPDGHLWKIGIADPKNPNEYIGFVEVFDKSVVTSGNYQRYFENDGKIYHHIINPDTGTPANSGLVSVTIISDESILSDALSTACFVLGKDKTLELYNSKKFSFEAILIEDNGNIITTDNANFTRKD